MENIENKVKGCIDTYDQLNNSVQALYLQLFKTDILGSSQSIMELKNKTGINPNEESLDFMVDQIKEDPNMVYKILSIKDLGLPKELIEKLYVNLYGIDGKVYHSESGTVEFNALEAIYNLYENLKILPDPTIITDLCIIHSDKGDMHDFDKYIKISKFEFPEQFGLGLKVNGVYNEDLVQEKYKKIIESSLSKAMELPLECSNGFIQKLAKKLNYVYDLTGIKCTYENHPENFIHSDYFYLNVNTYLNAFYKIGISENFIKQAFKKMNMHSPIHALGFLATVYNKFGYKPALELIFDFQKSVDESITKYGDYWVKKDYNKLFYKSAELGMGLSEKALKAAYLANLKSGDYKFIADLIKNNPQEFYQDMAKQGYLNGLEEVINILGIKPIFTEEFIQGCHDKYFENGCSDKINYLHKILDITPMGFFGILKGKLFKSKNCVKAKV